MGRTRVSREENHDSAARTKRKKAQACGGCGTRDVAFEWHAGASVAAGNRGKGETGADDAKQILLQRQSSESGGAVAPQTVNRQADRGKEGDRGDREGLRISVQSIAPLSRGAGRLGSRRGQVLSLF